MVKHDKGASRREFLKALGLAGAAGALTPAGLLGPGVREAQAAVPAVAVPRRPFGRSGREVSSLALGGMFDVVNGQLLLAQALKLGVDYWDTANSYSGGHSEEGFGRFFSRQPASRERVFLVTKSTNRDPQGLEAHLKLSLERLKTGYIDLFFVHGIKSTDELTDESLDWGKKAKDSGRIRLFGFSTHQNMADCLASAAKLNGIDGIMFTYNYRVMQDPALKDAVEACHAKGIGLTAMKTQAAGPARVIGEGDGTMELAERFLSQGYTPEQARLKAVWSDPRIAAVCSQMPSLNLLLANAAAAMDRKELKPQDLAWLADHARLTGAAYCAGCAGICERAMNGVVPVADVMRSLMYARAYGEPTWGRELLAEVLPQGGRELVEADFAPAQAACPQGLAIASLMRQAATEFGLG
ncbi:MAG: aldo/keto reductase [Deltaproteobacteria bacterium]|nr:aldo/keto reductase [Deltaproteobacteria bacterium]